jgi:hypothetical protein
VIEASEMHNAYCFAGQPAPCAGYFTNDILPCICSRESLLLALSQVAIPYIPATDLAPREVHILPLSA